MRDGGHGDEWDWHIQANAGSIATVVGRTAIWEVTSRADRRRDGGAFRWLSKGRAVRERARGAARQGSTGTIADFDSEQPASWDTGVRAVVGSLLCRVRGHWGLGRGGCVSARTRLYHVLPSRVGAKSVADPALYFLARLVRPRD